MGEEPCRHHKEQQTRDLEKGPEVEAAPTNVNDVTKSDRAGETGDAPEGHLQGSGGLGNAEHKESALEAFAEDHHEGEGGERKGAARFHSFVYAVAEICGDSAR